MQLSLALCITAAALSDALAPTRRRSALQKLTVGALSLTTAQRAAAATNAEAEKVRVASRELTELLKNERAPSVRISAPRGVPAPLRHRGDSSPGIMAVGGFFFGLGRVPGEPGSGSERYW